VKICVISGYFFQLLRKYYREMFREAGGCTGIGASCSV